MESYHLNPNGDVLKCEADVRSCPYGGIDAHATDKNYLSKLYEDFMTNLPRADRSVKFYFLQPFERNAFTMGDCSHFAKALHKKGLPIFYLGEAKSLSLPVSQRGFAHFVNRLPDGRFIDVEGIWTEKDLLERWGVDSLGSGFVPDTVALVSDVKDMRKMGASSPVFPHIKPGQVLKKIFKNIDSFL